MSDIERMQLSPKDPVQERKRDAKNRSKGICPDADYKIKKKEPAYGK